MEINVVEQPPQRVDYFPSWRGPGADTIAKRMNPHHVADVVEIFHTPLNGHFNWDYSSSDGTIRKLYKLGKTLNWNADSDIDWTIQTDQSRSPFVAHDNPLKGWAPYEALPETEKIRLDWHRYAVSLSQFVHGEQGALLVASQLASCAPTYDAKLYAASQTFDEARHVEVFSRYLREKIGIVYPINANLKSLIDKILSDERWDLKFIGMQIIIEGLALSAFQNLSLQATDDLIKQVIQLVLRDESRHVAFGVNYLADFIPTLTPEEIEARAEFAYQACVVMRDRLVGGEAFLGFDLDAEEAKKVALQSTVMKRFREILFQRVIPNLKRVHLLTDQVRPKYEDLGILDFEDAVSDEKIDWGEISKPLPRYVS